MRKTSPQNSINISVSLLFLFGLLWSCTNHSLQNRESLPYYNDHSFTPLWLAPESDSISHLHSIPNFSLLNQHGEIVNHSTLYNKIYIANFFFVSCPSICPEVTNNLSQVQSEFQNDKEILLLSHSVMPESDSVSVLKAYAEENDIISGKWHLLTGDKDEIYRMGRTAYLVERDLGIEHYDKDFIHSDKILLIDKKKHIRGIYNGLEKSSLNQLIDDIKILKEED